MAYKILLVDDEADILEFMSYNLRKEGFEVDTASNGYDAIEVAQRFIPDLIIMDVMMPQMDGIETCIEIRKIYALKDTIIAFLTARSEDYSQIAGFESGGDDYITKPIRPKVLISRIRALLKRADARTLQSAAELAAQSDVAVAQSSISIDRQRYVVTVRGREVTMPRKEFELLELLHSKPDKVFSRDEIFDAVWGDNVIVGDRTIDVHIRKLREKIGEDYIVTIKGVGYKFTDVESEV